jgi:hypothetical protein
MMNLTFNRKHRKISENELRYAVDWALRKLVGSRMMKGLDIEILFQKDPYSQGVCDAYPNDSGRARYFTITINPTLNYENTLRCIFHELVHVKQYARDELRMLNSRMNKWKGNIIPSGNYWEYPWEIEAYGMEFCLYRMYHEHIAEEEITFN